MSVPIGRIGRHFLVRKHAQDTYIPVGSGETNGKCPPKWLLLTSEGIYQLTCGSVSLPMREEPRYLRQGPIGALPHDPTSAFLNSRHPARGTHHGGSARVVSGTAGLRAVRADVCSTVAASWRRRP